MAYIGQRPVIGRYIKLDQISSGFNGSNTGFSMTAGSQAVFPGTARNLLLSLGGVIQEPDTDFTISGSTLTFTTAPVANTTFFGVIYGDMQATGTPSDGTVLPASIASSGHFKIPQLTVNEDGADVDFRVEGDTEANLLFVDASTDRVGIGTNSPDTLFHVESTGATSTRLSGNRGDANNLHIANIEFENTFNTQGVVAEIKAITGSSGTQSTRGQLTFSTDNGSALSERVRIDGSGNMQVSTGQFTVGTTATTGLQFINDGTFGTLHSANLTFRTGSSPKMILDTSGRLQIGSTNNSATGTKFVVGTGNNLTATALINTQDTDVNALTLSNWDGSATTNKVMMHFDNSGHGGFDVGMPAATDAFVIQDTDSSIRLRVNGDGHVDVTGNLDVGSGLDVTGDITGTSDLTLTGSDKKFISTSSSSGDYIRLYAGSGTGKWDIYGNGANLRFSDNDSAGKVVIDTELQSANFTISSANPTITFTETDQDPDFGILCNGGQFRLQDVSAPANLFTASATVLNSVIHHDFGAGIDVTGAITASTNITATGNIVSSSGQISVSDDGGTHHLSVGANADLKIYHDDGGPSIISDGANQGVKVSLKDLNITEYTGNTTHVFIDTGGKVGIGTTSPEGVGIDITKSRTNTYGATSDNRNLAHLICRNGSDAAGRFASISMISGGGTQAEGSINLVQQGNYAGDLTFKLRTEVSAWAERLRIDTTGRLLVGVQSSLGVLGLAAQLQIAGSSAGGSSLALRRFGDTAQGAFLTFSKSRNAADGSRTIAQSGDELGRIAFCMDDGTDLAHAGAEIRANVDGTPAENDTPGRLVFLTSQSGNNGSLTERYRITNGGNLEWRSRAVRQRKHFFYVSQSGNTVLDTKISDNFLQGDMARVQYSYMWNDGDGGAWGTAIVWRHHDGPMEIRKLGEEIASPAEDLTFYFDNTDDLYIRFDLTANSGMNGYAYLSVECGGCDPHTF